MFRKILKNNPNFQEGISLFFTVIIMAVLLSVALGVTTILLGQVKMIKTIGDSVVAFHAADSGIEHTLYKIYRVGDLGAPSSTWGKDYGYATVLTIIEGEASSTVLSSEGEYQKAHRAVEARIGGIHSPLISDCEVNPYLVEVNISGIDGVATATIKIGDNEPVALREGDGITYSWIVSATGTVTIYACDGMEISHCCDHPCLSIE